jgi:hypothetical protein
MKTAVCVLSTSVSVPKIRARAGAGVGREKTGETGEVRKKRERRRKVGRTEKLWLAVWWSEVYSLDIHSLAKQCSVHVLSEDH